MLSVNWRCRIYYLNLLSFPFFFVVVVRKTGTKWYLFRNCLWFCSLLYWDQFIKFVYWNDDEQFDRLNGSILSNWHWKIMSNQTEQINLCNQQSFSLSLLLDRKICKLIWIKSLHFIVIKQCILFWRFR